MINAYYHVFSAASFAIFLVAAPEEGGNVLTKEVLDIVFQLDGNIRALEVSVEGLVWLVEHAAK